MLDVAAALAWSGSLVGSEVVAHERLPGGLTSRMLALRHGDGSGSVLRLMTNAPWRTHGAALTTRERDALLFLEHTPVPAPRTLGLDADAHVAGVSAHLTTRVPGAPVAVPDQRQVGAMADLLAVVHAQAPAAPFRTFESWAWPEKWVVPPWTRHAASWQRAFEVLAGPAPAYAPTFLHRDFGHRNLLWRDGEVSGLVDWVETSTGPAWLDAAHAASTLAVLVGHGPAEAFLDAYAHRAGAPADPFWLVMDAVGHLPPPGRPPLFREPAQHARLDAWLHRAVTRR
ncbi:phosphotransferase family protein [Nocardioides zeicaulis]|uniref:Phosphotransferase family protein n=1 Tax=Nocardioides zeicaulis TaxID=1776857 RepID=A0ABV6E5D2_9ACTN